MVLYASYQSAIIYGTVIGLLTLGFRLTHESSGYMNLGHTVNLGVGMAFGFIVIQQFNLTPILGAPISFILTGLFNLLVYSMFYRRMETRNYSEALIALFGIVSVYVAENVLTVAEYLMRLSFPSEYWCGPPPISFSTQHLHYRVSSAGVFIGGFVEILVVFSAVTFLFHWMYQKRQGVFFRAVGENPLLVEVSGISSVKIKANAWFIAGGLAGIAGVILPFIFKGEMGRDVQIITPMVAAALITEKRTLWKAGLAGLMVGFLGHVLIKWGQIVIGVMVGEYRGVIEAGFLVLFLFFKDRRIQWSNWLSPRRQ